MAWIRTDNANLRSIRIEGMDDEIFFTTKRYSEVDQDVADLLTAAVPGITDVSEPGDPGSYYGSDVDNTTVTVTLDSDTFEDVTVTGTMSATTVLADDVGTEMNPTQVWAEPLTHDNVRNVKSYGAVGDGSTDDSAAIQAAIDDLTALGGGTVYFPEPDSSYLIDTSVKPKDNVWYYGDGWPRLTAGDLGLTAMFENTDGLVNARWTGLEFDGSGGWTQTGYSPEQKAIFLKPSGGNTDDLRDVQIDRCYVHDIVATPLGIDSCINDWYLYNKLVDNGTDSETTGSNGIGVGVGEVDGLCPTYIIGNYIENTAQYAIIFEQTGDILVGAQAYVAGNVIDGCRDAVGVEHLFGFSVVNNHIRNADRDFFRIGTLDGNESAKYGDVSGNYCLTAGQHAVHITSQFVDGVFVSNNQFRSVTGDILNAPSDATIYLNGEGREAAGTGNEPTASEWAPEGYGCDVRNTDDGAIFRLNPDDTWTQIG